MPLSERTSALQLLLDLSQVLRGCQDAGQLSFS